MLLEEEGAEAAGERSEEDDGVNGEGDVEHLCDAVVAAGGFACDGGECRGVERGAVGAYPRGLIENVGGREGHDGGEHGEPGGSAGEGGAGGSAAAHGGERHAGGTRNAQDEQGAQQREDRDDKEQQLPPRSPKEGRGGWCDDEPQRVLGDEDDPENPRGRQQCPLEGGSLRRGALGQHEHHEEESECGHRRVEAVIEVLREAFARCGGTPEAAPHGEIDDVVGGLVDGVRHL